MPIRTDLPKSKICPACGKEFLRKRNLTTVEWERRKFCSQLCSNKAVKKNNKKHRLDIPAKSKYVSSINDQQQRELNITIDNKTRLTFESRSIKPGDPDFDAIAKQVTPLKYIHKQAPRIIRYDLYGAK